MQGAGWWRSVVVDNRAMAAEGWRALRALDWRPLISKALKLRYWYWWFLAAAFFAFAILAVLFRDDILVFVEPRRDAILAARCSWLVPVAVLVAVEFPPLAGHFATAVATGAIWGFKIGVLIVFAGTLLGEILCFVAFSTFLRAKAESIEQEKPLYAYLARSVRSAGLLDVIALRLSALPGRVTTAVAATIGVPFRLYSVALIVALPKELVFVYAGSLFASTGSPKTPALTAALVVVAALMTLVALDVILLMASLAQAEGIQGASRGGIVRQQRE
ncbi:hypothetical protein JCM8208_006180 [Rhodotorula glutinis]